MTDMPEMIWVELKPIDLGSSDGPFWAVTSGLADIEWDGATAYRRADLPPKVKSLEWVVDSLPNSAPQRYRAKIPGGMGDYSVTGIERKNEWQWFRNGYFVDGHQHHKPMTIEDAKAAAQADYTARILAALEGEE
jgi:hypothetical protein